MCSTPSKATHQRPNYPEIRSSTMRAACPNENGDGWSAALCEKWVASKSLLADSGPSIRQDCDDLNGRYCCDINRSMQHLNSYYRDEVVEYEYPTRIYHTETDEALMWGRWQNPHILAEVSSVVSIDRIAG
jgi:hypothetical protein